MTKHQNHKSRCNYSLQYKFFLFVIWCVPIVSFARLPDSKIHVLNGAHSFYIDNKNGNDLRNGLSPATAWQSIEKLNSIIFIPGDKILFKSGGVWNGGLRLKGSGSQLNAITVGSYGSGKKPLIAGNGISDGTIYLFNQSFWNITNLEITNYNAAEENGTDLKAWELQNLQDYALPHLPPQLANKNSFKYGIYVKADNVGVINHIHLANLNIHGVNGCINQKDELSKNNGGVVFEVTGVEKPTYFDDVRIEECNVHDVDRTGILLVKSSWDKRTLDSNISWLPSKNIVINKCRFSNTGANALLVRNAIKPVIEHNLFDHCAIKASGNASFSFNCDSAVWQYNECRYTTANVDDLDAGGMDADYKTKSTIIQYNYIHDNDYGMLITGGPKSFNEGTIIRYNIFENDAAESHPKHGKGFIRVNGNATNTQIYNNVFFLKKGQTETKIVSHEQWSDWPKHTVYQNNIFYNLSINALYDFGQSQDNIFRNNNYYGNTAANTPADLEHLLANPQLVDPGNGKPQGYKLKAGSPVIKRGIVIKHNGGKDFFGKNLPVNERPNIGVDDELFKDK